MCTTWILRRAVLLFALCNSLDAACAFASEPERDLPPPVEQRARVLRPPVERQAGEDWPKRALSAVFSPDDKWVAAAVDDEITIWDVSTGAIVRSFVNMRSAPYHVITVAFSPDGRLLASGGDETPIRLWDAQTGQQVREFAGGNGSPRTLEFSANGSMLAADGFRSVFVWDTATGRLLKRIDEWGKGAGAYGSVFLSPDSLTISAVGTDAGDFRSWNLQTGQRVGYIDVDSESRFAARSANGKRFVVGGSIHHLTVFDGTTLKQIRDFKPRYGDHPTACSISPDGSRVVLTQRDIVQIWNVDSDKEAQIRIENCRWIASANFSRDGRHLVTADWAGGVRIWNVPD